MVKVLISILLSSGGMSGINGESDFVSRVYHTRIGQNILFLKGIQKPRCTCVSVKFDPMKMCVVRTMNRQQLFIETKKSLYPNLPNHRSAWAHALYKDFDIYVQCIGREG